MNVFCFDFQFTQLLFVKSAKNQKNKMTLLKKKAYSAVAVSGVVQPRVRRMALTIATLGMHGGHKGKYT